MPPKKNVTLNREIRMVGKMHTAATYSAPPSVMRVRMRSMYSAVFTPGRMPGM